MRSKLNIVKIGGNVIDHPEMRSIFLKQFSALEGPKILVHGGGSIATALSKKLGSEPTMIDGRRVTSKSELDTVVMVYAGLINKQLVAGLQKENCNAIGLSGTDGNCILSELRDPEPVNYGFVGDVIAVNNVFFKNLITNHLTPVVCAVTHDGEGNLLNTNADTIASKLAVSMSTFFDVALTYCFEKSGVLKDKNDDQSVIETIHRSSFENLRKTGAISDGMLPKLQNCLRAIDEGVQSVCIVSADNLLRKQPHTKISPE